MEKKRREPTLSGPRKQEVSFSGSTQVRNTVSRIQQGRAHAIGQLRVWPDVERLVVAKVTKNELVSL